MSVPKPRSCAWYWGAWWEQQLSANFILPRSDLGKSALGTAQLEHPSTFWFFYFCYALNWSAFSYQLFNLYTDLLRIGKNPCLVVILVNVDVFWSFPLSYGFFAIFQYLFLAQLGILKILLKYYKTSYLSTYSKIIGGF